MQKMNRVWKTVKFFIKQSIFGATFAAKWQISGPERLA
jgi:hypothetical protein